MNTVLRISVRKLTLCSLAALTLAACQSEGDRSATSDSATRADSGAAMDGMAGMEGMMDAGMMDSMQSHMTMMDTMTGDQMKEMLSRHRQMADSMLSRMGSDMRGMNMAADPGWDATADSLRQDLARMSGMGAQELKTMMPAHRARMTRLMTTHRDMMGKMQR